GARRGGGVVRGGARLGGGVGRGGARLGEGRDAVLALKWGRGRLHKWDGPGRVGQRSDQRPVPA
uniref:hypothetical protein n=1 Tax=Dietzia alimentaria TaxID=665550 RepID=UPI00029A8F38